MKKAKAKKRKIVWVLKTYETTQLFDSYTKMIKEISYTNNGENVPKLQIIKEKDNSDGVICETNSWFNEKGKKEYYRTYHSFYVKTVH